jgi:hypothetical protein
MLYLSQFVGLDLTMLLGNLVWLATGFLRPAEQRPATAGRTPGCWANVLHLNDLHSILDYLPALTPGGAYVLVGGATAQFLQSMPPASIMETDDGRACNNTDEFG